MLGENGLPMWMPKPTSLPEDRIAEGIVPGDVGLLTEDGTSFHYLFNIWRDRQTLEEAHVPGGRDFLPAPERVLQAPAEEFLTGMGTILEGAAEERVYMSDSPPPHCNLHYGWCEEEGAVLVTPFGAHVDSLADRTVLEPFIKHNCRRLYQVAKNKGGIRTAPLYIVTGCVKTSSWAMAAYRTSKKRPTAAGATMAPVAKLQNVLKSQESERTSFGYQWTSKSNGTSAHSGPNFCSSASDDRNQCLFIRGYRLSAFLDDEASSGQCITVASDEKGSNPAHYGSVSSLKGAESASGLFRSTATSNKESFQLDAMPQQRSLNPGECINGFMSSPEANRIINQVNRNFAHPPVSCIPALQSVTPY
ncbi:hypothetical protein FA15DRAFT_498410 [Coprinopsis marcescibilis]|uniref:Uncharacterized protein n=1 Tax=Coprinopsis marcescibilis TaxID=230819 RepID=A0A5C3KR27_COPMA|nr:hypothetical protein FA15DRAFT_498410 [Coprinopsis marcescibilis]